MIVYSELLKTLSSLDKKTYTARNTKLTIKKDGVFKTGREKLLATIKYGDVVIFSGEALETEKKQLMFDDSSLYKVEYIIE